MSDEPYVYISYSRRDSETAVRRLVDNLEKKGIRTWVDISSISPGESFVTAMAKAVLRASAFVFIVSKTAVDSPWIMGELRTALERGSIPVFPVNVAAFGETNLPEELKTYTCVDLGKDWNSGVEALFSALNKVVKPGQSREPKPKINEGYVFLSYAVQDCVFLTELTQFLKTQKYGFWDFHANKRDYRRQFHLEIEGMIREAVAVLCLLSPDWKRSRWTAREFLFAEEIGKPIYLLRFRVLEPTLLISGLSYIDFVDNIHGGFEELDREMKASGL